MRTDRVDILLKRANLQFDRMANQALAPYNLTHTQFRVLKLLRRRPPLTVRQADIEEFFSMTNPTVTGILHNLERKGLIRRVSNPKDGRSKVIGLTEKADELLPALEPLNNALEAELTRSLTPEERRQLLALLQKLTGCLPPDGQETPAGENDSHG